MQVTVQKIDIVTKVSGAGKPFQMFELFTDKHGQTKLTKFVDKNDPVKYWRVGDVVNIREVPNGKFMNFAVEELKTNSNSGAVLPPSTPAYVPPISSTGSQAEVSFEELKVDRNYKLLLRIARQVGVPLTDDEINDSLDF